MSRTAAEPAALRWTGCALLMPLALAAQAQGELATTIATGGPVTGGAASAALVATAGALMGAAAVYITVLRRRNARVRALAERHSAEAERFFTLSLDMLCIAGTDGYFRRLNAAFTTALGWSAEELTSRPFVDFVHPDDREATAREVERLRSGLATVHFENRYRHRDGSYRWLAWTTAPAPDSDLLYAAARDITAQREADEALRAATRSAREASEAKSSFLAVMSHELRTPLNGVIGMTELLRDTRLDERQRRFVQACHQSAQSLLGIINDILDFSKIEAARLELDLDEFALHQCIDDSIALMAHRAHAKGLELDYYVDPRIRQPVIGDHVRLRQILVNLLGNAIKFTAEGRIILRAVLESSDGEHIVARCWVADTGPGIPADRIAQLFQPFTQLECSATRHHGGTGLGLAICRSLVEAMGGEIGVESEQGAGSTFWFTLDLKRIDGPVTDMLRAPADLRGLRVLVVSEATGGESTLAETLASWQIEADVVAPDERVVELVRGADPHEPPFDLVLFDVPVADGMAASVVRRALAGPHPAAMRCFVLVPTTEEGAAEFGGATVIPTRLRKPPSASELLNALVDAFCCGAAAGAEAREPAPPPCEPGRSARILVAEDNPTSRLYVREVLTRAGHVCHVATTGAEAVAAVQQGSFDLVLMDCHMPGMDGFEATAAIRADESEGRRLPIVALTANAVKGDRERCLAADMDDYLSKPVEARQLVKKVEQWINGGRAEASVAAAPARPAAEEEADAPFDAEVALSRCMGDAAFLWAALDSFAGEAPGYLRELERQLAEGDAGNLWRTAHCIRGAAGLVTADVLAALAAEIEDAGRAGRIEQCAALVERLREELDRCLRHIARVEEESTAR